MYHHACSAVLATLTCLQPVTVAPDATHQRKLCRGACHCVPKPGRGAQTVITDEFRDAVFQRGLQDLNMMVAQHARERTPAQWTALLAAGGFRMARVAATRSAFSVVVAVPAA